MPIGQGEEGCGEPCKGPWLYGHGNVAYTTHLTPIDWRNTIQFLEVLQYHNDSASSNPPIPQGGDHLKRSSKIFLMRQQTRSVDVQAGSSSMEPALLGTAVGVF